MKKQSFTKQIAYDHPENRERVRETIWNKLVKGNDNIFMVVCGHISGWNHQESTNDYGNPVIEILTDYQWEPNGLSSEQYGGNGWLNLMRFVPSENKIYFKSYSPYLNKWWDNDPLHEYTLDYQMGPKPSTLLILVAGLLAVCAWKFRWPFGRKQVPKA